MSTHSTPDYLLIGLDIVEFNIAITYMNPCLIPTIGKTKRNDEDTIQVQLAKRYLKW